ncbi:MAG: translation initiation factor IF-2 subunit gamma, partial [Proteobacteria bacterium]|nr:translation initiation factor IF-2 subunit gamma [Pseudomonadota bacterium]
MPEITHDLKIKSNLFEEVLGIQEHKKTEPIKTKETLMLNVNTTITVGIVEKIDKEGKEIELSLSIPIVEIKGDNVGIARNFDRHWR